MNEKEIIFKNIKLSAQSAIILKQMPEFPMDAFLEWWMENYMVIGGGHIVEFIDKKMR